MNTRGVSRRDFLKSGFLAAALAAAKPARADVRPNFIVVIGDDVGGNDIGAYGNPLVRTPRVDRMAREGLQFENAFLTISSCSPSRASIMTGLYPHNTQAAELHLPLPADSLTIASILKEAGYYTVCAGKFHMGYIKGHFDLVTDSQTSGCEKWIQVLQDRPKEKPFFFWFASHDAHRPWQATTGARALANPHTNEEVVVPPFFPDTPEVRRDLAQYYDEVSRLDGYTGQVLDELEKQGIAENTFVLFMSDNGRPFPRCKTTTYDSGIKTPFIVRWPGRVAPGQKCHSLVSSVDVAPTLIELAGLEVPKRFEGVPFTPMLEDTSATTREYIYAEHNWHDYQAHERAVRSKKYLYIKNSLPELPRTPPADAVTSATYSAMKRLRDEGKLTPALKDIFAAPRPEEELYEVEKDPNQFNNLAENPEYAAILKEMRGKLADWIEDTGDKMPENLTPDGFDRETGERLFEGRNRPDGLQAF